MKYIPAEKLIAEIRKLRSESCISESDDYYEYAKSEIIDIITSLQQEQPDFPTTDEEIERLLATHPKVEVPDKYKTPDWLWKKQEQPEVDLEEAARHVYESWMGGTMDDVRRDMAELGKVLNARKEE